MRKVKELHWFCMCYTGCLWLFIGIVIAVTIGLSIGEAMATGGAVSGVATPISMVAMEKEWI